MTGRTSGRGSPPAPCPGRTPARPAGPRRWPGPGCRWARRAAAASTPASSSSRICSRACWPPDIGANGCCAQNCSSYRASAAMDSLRSSACSVMRISAGHRSARSGRAWVCANSPGHHPRAEPGHTLVRHVRAAQQLQEGRLARPVGAEHGHPLAVPDLEVERVHQPGQLQALRRSPPACRSARRAAASGCCAPAAPAPAARPPRTGSSRVTAACSRDAMSEL